MRSPLILLTTVLLAACQGDKEPSGTDTTDSDTSMATGDTATSCEVTARDDTARACTDLVVFCDVSPENASANDACMECMGGFDAYWLYWQEELLDAHADFYEACATVDLPPRPETCSPLLGSAASPAAELFEPAAVGLVWTDGTTSCLWATELSYYGLPLPVTASTEAELAPYLYCYEGADYTTTVVPPPGVYEALGLADHFVHVYDENTAAWLGLHDGILVFDEGCGGVSGIPLPPLVQAVLIDRTEALPTTASCRAAACPAEIRDAPIPP